CASSGPSRASGSAPVVAATRGGRSPLARLLKQPSSSSSLLPSLSSGTHHTFIIECVTYSFSVRRWQSKRAVAPRGATDHVPTSLGQVCHPGRGPDHSARVGSGLLPA